MDDTELTQMADFLSIALEQMEAENYDTAQEFVEDVYGMLQEEIDE